MKRRLFLLRLLLIRDGYRKAEYLKRKHYFYSQGERCFFTPYNFGTEPHLISFGNNVYVASGVVFVNHDITAKMFQYMEPEVKHVNRVGKIEIGNNVFIGARATILYDVKIGDNVIIAAGALVNSDVPSGTIYAGVPAKRIGSFDDYIRKSRRYSSGVDWNNDDPEIIRKERQINYIWRKDTKEV